jgi:hypothetical protein
MKFYCISTDYKYKDIDYAENTDWESIVCPVYEGHQRTGNRIGNMEIELPDEGKRDLYWTFLSELVITGYLADLLKSNSITGFKLKPVEVVNKKTNLKYWEFVPTGNGGISYNYHLSYKCEFCGHKYYRDIDEPLDKELTPVKRILVNNKNWDGSDIFTVEGLERHILITDKVKDLIISNNIKGCLISPAEYLKHQIYPAKKAS